MASASGAAPSDTPGAPGVLVLGCWQLEQQIGVGSFAVVWKARHAEDGRPAAVKEIRTEKLNKKLLESLESEVAVLRRLSSAHIVSLFDVEKARPAPPP